METAIHKSITPYNEYSDHDRNQNIFAKISRSETVSLSEYITNHDRQSRPDNGTDYIEEPEFLLMDPTRTDKERYESTCHRTKSSENQCLAGMFADDSSSFIYVQFTYKEVLPDFVYEIQAISSTEGITDIITEYRSETCYYDDIEEIQGAYSGHKSSKYDRYMPRNQSAENGQTFQNRDPK